MEKSVAKDESYPTYYRARMGGVEATVMRWLEFVWKYIFSVDILKLKLVVITRESNFAKSYLIN